MKRPMPFLLAMCVLVLAGCASAPAPRVVEVSPDLRVERIDRDVWLHTSWQKLSDGTRFPSNGLIVRDGGHLVLVDTAWGDPLTAELMTWIDRTLKLPVERAIVTHFHDDRMGGAPALIARGIPFFGQPRTAEIAKEKGLSPPQVLEALATPGSATRVGRIEIFSPGPAHAPDNVVVWLARERILFGGCMVRAAGTKALGNTADADLAAWPASARRLVERYAATARVVVPGHGERGGADLLTHTVTLVDAASTR